MEEKIRTILKEITDCKEKNDYEKVYNKLNDLVISNMEEIPDSLRETVYELLDQLKKVLEGDENGKIN